MKETIIVQYAGFRVSSLGREYSFSVRESGGKPREYTLTIGNAAFDSRRVRYQDAPDICSLRLHQELAISTNHPVANHFGITDAELDAYDARRQKPRKYL